MWSPIWSEFFPGRNDRLSFGLVRKHQFQSGSPGQGTVTNFLSVCHKKAAQPYRLRSFYVLSTVFSVHASFCVCFFCLYLLFSACVCFSCLYLLFFYVCPLLSFFRSIILSGVLIFAVHCLLDDINRPALGLSIILGQILTQNTYSQQLNS